jgi:predicted aldo/keto reductase-like oxidoreductase
MEKNIFGKTGEKISMLGFGMMRLPTDPSGKIDRVKASEMIDEAIAGGVNYFDTAYPYHYGESEDFAGEALSRYSRDSYYLASKFPMWNINSDSDIDRIFDEQLKKCRVDYFDFYLVHSMNEQRIETLRDFKIYERLREKQREGRLRHLGFSFHDTPGVLRQIVGMYDWEFAQIQMNYFDWELQRASEQHKILTDANLPVIVMEPVRGGALASLCDESVRIFREADPNASPASWALRFAASQRGIMTVLSGMTDISQVRDNLNTMNNFRPLSGDEPGVIERALAAYRSSAAVPCTNCRYCMDCPAGVEIPVVISMYNDYRAGKAQNSPAADAYFSLVYGGFRDKHGAVLCVGCNECLTKCPQKIDIPGAMETIEEIYKKLADAV